jgi:hypothetical protein
MELMIGMAIGAAIVGVIWAFGGRVEGAILRWLGLEPRD